MVSRLIEAQIQSKLDDRKVLVITGPRQVGKTTVLQNLFGQRNDAIWINGDEPDARMLLQQATSTKLKRLIGGKKLVIIDEAQRVENVGLTLKIIHDQLPEVKVIATGSSSFEIANKINEPLTGRKWEFNMYPFSAQEMIQHHGELDESRKLEDRLIFGSYPDVINNPGEEKGILSQLADSYLYKDLLTWNRVQKPDKLEILVQALAFQVGQQVSYSELSQITGLDNETVEVYVSVLEKAFIIFRLGPLSRNLRNELKKTRKIYFLDNGIRNAVIKQFNPIGLRDDVGALWENYLISERLKFNAYNQNLVNQFFWRTHAQQEIDYLEEHSGLFDVYEFKWNPHKNWKAPKAFIDSYKTGVRKVITPINYQEFVDVAGI